MNNKVFLTKEQQANGSLNCTIMHNGQANVTQIGVTSQDVSYLTALIKALKHKFKQSMILVRKNETFIVSNI